VEDKVEENTEVIPNTHDQLEDEEEYQFQGQIEIDDLLKDTVILLFSKQPKKKLSQNQKRTKML
jgi:hypothetical protein